MQWIGTRLLKARDCCYKEAPWNYSRINNWSFSQRNLKSHEIHHISRTARVMDTRHRRSPLIQGGLEIPIQVTVTMPYSPANKEAMIMYEDLVNKWYKEPEDGKFEDTTKEILEAVSGDRSMR